VGDGDRKADFSTSRRPGRNGEFCSVEGMVKETLRRDQKLKSENKKQILRLRRRMTTKIENLTAKTKFKDNCNANTNAEAHFAQNDTKFR
jgi:hypothetical protein